MTLNAFRLGMIAGALFVVGCYVAGRYCGFL